MDQSYLEEICWNDVRKRVEAYNPTLCKIIDNLNPAKKLTLFKAKYSYGDEIIKKGKLHLPYNKSLLPIDSKDIPSHVSTKLGYNLGTNPVSMVLHNSIEIFMLIEQRTIPLYGLISPGKIFSTSRILSVNTPFSPPFLWDMTAGARSIFMLPRISDYVGHSKIMQEFNVQLSPPEGLLDQWQLFREIIKNCDLKSPWYTEMLFFTDKWFEHLDDAAWKDFRLYLLQSAWESSEFWRNQFVWDLVFCVVQRIKNLKPNPYIADTVKHILAMSVGATPGFVPAIDDKAAPCKELEKIYSEVYQLKDYQPIVMHPHNFSLGEERPVYYSLQYPSTMEFSPKSKRTANKITDLREVRYVLDKYFLGIKQGILNVNGTPFQDICDTVKFDYFHTNTKKYEGIRDSSKIPSEDRHMKTVYEKATQKLFPENSPFIRGSVRIMKK